MVTSLQKFRQKYFGVGTTLGKTSRKLKRAGKTILASVTGKGVTAHVKQPKVKKILETAGSHPFLTAGVATGGIMAAKVALPAAKAALPTLGRAATKAAPKVGRAAAKGGTSLLKSKTAVSIAGTTATVGLIDRSLLSRKNVGRIAGYTINPKAALFADVYSAFKSIGAVMPQGKPKQLAAAGAGIIGAGAGALIVKNLLSGDDKKKNGQAAPLVTTPSNGGVSTSKPGIPESPPLLGAQSTVEVAQPLPIGAVEPVVSPSTTTLYKKRRKKAKKKKKSRHICRIRRRRRQPSINKASNVNRIYIQNKAG